MISLALNKIDMGILKCLSENCRMSYEELGCKIDVTSTTVKKHVTALLSDGTISRFSTELSCSMISARSTLTMIKTEGSEQRNQFMEEIGRNPLVESVSCLESGRYLVDGICAGIQHLADQQSFFENNPRIDSFVTHLMQNQDERKTSFTKLELEILNLLYQEPRMSLVSLATNIGRSSKSVRNAVIRLIDNSKVHFTVKPHIHYYFVESSFQNDESNFIQNTIFPHSILSSIWRRSYSSSERIFFTWFMIERISDISNIRGYISNIPNWKTEYESIGEPTRYFESIRTDEMLKLLGRGKIRP